MDYRERFLACLSGEPVDRAPFYLCFPPWETTVERWENEGMTHDTKIIHKDVDK